MTAFTYFSKRRGETQVSHAKAPVYIRRSCKKQKMKSKAPGINCQAGSFRLMDMIQKTTLDEANTNPTPVIMRATCNALSASRSNTSFAAFDANSDFALAPRESLRYLFPIRSKQMALNTKAKEMT
jgi:hypothetical protein